MTIGADAPITPSAFASSASSPPLWGFGLAVSPLGGHANSSRRCWRSSKTVTPWRCCWLRQYAVDFSKSIIPVDSWCSYPLQKLPRGYSFRNPGCRSNIFLALWDFSMISASCREYRLGTLTWKCTCTPANPNSPNSNPNGSSSRNPSIQVSMWDCFRKQLYLHLVLNSIVTQLFRVSPAIFLELPLFTSSILFISPVAPL